MRSVALIPKCAECEGVWLPANKERWQAWLTDDEPPELAFYCRTAPSASLATTETGERQGGPRG